MRWVYDGPSHNGNTWTLTSAMCFYFNISSKISNNKCYKHTKTKMGYLVIQTQTQGQIVIDGNRVISITKGEKNGDQDLDLIPGAQRQNPR